MKKQIRSKNKNMMRELFTTLLAGLMVVALAAALTGCGAKKEENKEEKDEATVRLESTAEGLTANFTDKNKGTGGGSGIDIKEGQYLSIDNQLTKGEVHVTVKAGGDDPENPPINDDTPATIDYVFDANGGVTDYYEIAPGSYMVFFSVEKDAVGTMYANVKDKE